MLEGLSQASLTRALTLQEVIDSFGTRCHSLLIIFLSIPFLQPIPLIGLSTPMGVMIIIVAFFQVLKKKPWVPKIWQKKEIPSKILVKTEELAKKYFGKLTNKLSRRWTFYFSSRSLIILNFFIISILAVFLALPLPVPFSNTFPAVAIFINGVGQLEEDGVLVSISYMIFLVTLIFFSAIWLGASFGADAVAR